MNKEFLDAVNESVQISQQKWVKWQHEMMGIIHCGSCLALHDCWFVFGNEPIAPLHEKCHCTTVAIPTSQVKSRAKATSDYRAFDAGREGMQCGRPPSVGSLVKGYRVIKGY